MSNLNRNEFHVHGIARDLDLLKSRLFEPPTGSLSVVDLLRKGQTYDSFEVKGGIDLSIYITHVPTLAEKIYLNLELITLQNFIQLAIKNHCQRIVYIARLMDKPFIPYIQKVLEDSKLVYTIVLKNLAIGKGSVLDKYMRQMLNSKYLAYDGDIANVKFSPIYALDLLRWIYNVDWTSCFKNEIIEIGGSHVLTIQEMYRMYKKQLYPDSPVKSFRMPSFLMRLLYKKMYHINKEDIVEFNRLMKMEYPIDNSSWKNVVLFSFTPLDQVIKSDQ
ncbi:hypothetical protein [Sphingobacterium sp. HJSM2_6]|uniref:hypothetical protein n=1 Tax=Sphingobacterium sp. HJSM2_6 TaxID=3366264 RepID=UPI003BF5CF06